MVKKDWILKSKKSITNTIKLKAQLKVTDALYSKSIDTEAVIKQELAKQLIFKALEKNACTFFKHPYSASDPFAYETYEAHLNVSPPSIDKTIVTDYYFEVKGEKFNYNEIEEALKYTFPERFI